MIGSALLTCRLVNAPARWHRCLMSIAITLSANNATADAVRRLWRVVSTFEDEPSMERIGYSPHITLGIWHHADTEEIGQAVHKVFESRSAFRVTFDRLRHFDVEPLVLWAAPRDVTGLRALHGDVHTRLDVERCHELYRPEAWIAHCTLGTHIAPDRRDAALAFASRPLQPFEVVFDRVDWVSAPTVEVMGQFPLGAERV